MRFKHPDILPAPPRDTQQPPPAGTQEAVTAVTLGVSCHVTAPRATASSSFYTPAVAACTAHIFSGAGATPLRPTTRLSSPSCPRGSDASRRGRAPLRTRLGAPRGRVSRHGSPSGSEPTARGSKQATLSHKRQARLLSPAP